MILKSFLLVLPVYYFLLECNVVNGWKHTTNVYLQLRRQFNLLNERSVETIQTIYGDSYGCVDFYKQPAFDHPLLKNHSYTYQTKDSVRRITNDSNAKTQYSNIWLNGKGCPNGTVPIRRITKDDLTRLKEKFKSHDSPIHGFTTQEPGVHYAVLRTQADYPKYHGAGMKASLHKPHVVIFQFSGSQMKLQSDSDYIQVGWMVNPNLNVDSNARMFIYTHTKRWHCYNMLCSGFVLTREDRSVDHILRPTSHQGGPITVYDFVIERDDSTGNWMLKVGPFKEEIGFWPKFLFTDLGYAATYAEWGGVVYSTTGIPSPVMGTGDITTMDTDYDSFCCDVVVIEQDQQTLPASNCPLEEYSDSEKYKVKKSGYQHNIGYLFFYGGNGGATGN